MLSVGGKSITFFIAYVAIFVDPHLLVEHLFAHSQDLKIFLCLEDDVLAITLCPLEVIDKIWIQVRCSDIVLIHFIVIVDVENLQLFHHCGVRTNLASQSLHHGLLFELFVLLTALIDEFIQLFFCIIFYHIHYFNWLNNGRRWLLTTSSFSLIFISVIEVFFIDAEQSQCIAVNLGLTDNVALRHLDIRHTVTGMSHHDGNLLKRHSLL